MLVACERALWVLLLLAFCTLAIQVATAGPLELCLVLLAQRVQVRLHFSSIVCLDQHVLWPPRVQRAFVVASHGLHFCCLTAAAVVAAAAAAAAAAGGLIFVCTSFSSFLLCCVAYDSH